MNMMMMIFVFIISAALLLPATTSYNFSIAKPNCADSCGGVRIPYPAGTTPESYFSPSFWVTCNHTNNPPRLFWQKTTMEITDINLDGQMRMMQPIWRVCSSDAKVYNSPLINMTTDLTLNSTANRFNVVGCFASAIMFTWHTSFDKPLLPLAQSQTSSCRVTCYGGGDTQMNPCTGEGCCQTSFPGNVSVSQILIRTSTGDNDSCTYAFVAEEKHNLTVTGLNNIEALPVVVDWVVGNSTCDAAKMNTTSYACVSSFSSCYQIGVSDGGGYRCRCDGGFEGNPYLINGCRDINECADSTLNKCSKNEYCTNTDGSYKCSCPKGYSGNGVRDGGGCTKKTDMNMMTNYIIMGSACGGVIALLVVAFIVYMILKRRSMKKMKRAHFLQNGGLLLQERVTRMGRSASHLMKIFTLSDLKNATKDFHSSMVVGEGGFGTVYRGLLPDKSEVAIKKSTVNPSQNEVFINEILVLSQVNHRHIVRLLGCCLETETPLLVYEFVSNGTLSSHIHEREKADVFSWDMRLRVAAETAAVLSYLHSGAADTPILHRDVKPDNILLDLNFSARVSDFGSSKLVSDQAPARQATRMHGTFGYFDPEFMESNHFTDKSDVYSFGVVLLELMTGRRALIRLNEEDEVAVNLGTYFFNMVNQNVPLTQIVDVNIAPERNIEQISQVVRIAEGCLRRRGEDRPSMKEVAAELEGLMQPCVIRNEGNVTGPPAAYDEVRSSNIHEYDRDAFNSLMAGGR